MGSNYEFQSLEWGKFLSTSNEIVKDVVKVRSSHSLFFVAELGNKNIKIVQSDLPKTKLWVLYTICLLVFNN